FSTDAAVMRLQKPASTAGHLEELEIEGLTHESALVVLSGLSILIAIVELLDIDTMSLPVGFLLRQDDIRARTIGSIQSRYQLDSQYGQQVANLALKLLQQVGDVMWIPEPQGAMLLETTAKLHEIGLTIDFKKGGEHSAYLMQHLDLPGFTRAQKFLMGEIARRYREGLTSLPEQHALSGNSGKRLLRLLRLAVILSHRR
ncbi:guanosine polyphosphate pyrophosphohydrolase, partial [Vibrio vulnificus]